MHYHPRDADDTGIKHGFAKQCINLLALSDGLQKVGAFEKREFNFTCLDERFDLDGLGRLGIRSLDLFVAQNHIVAVILLDAFDNVFALNNLARAFIYTLVTDRIHRSLIQPVKINTFFLCCRIKRDRNMYEPKSNGAFPDCVRHDCSLFDGEGAAEQLISPAA